MTHPGQSAAKRPPRGGIERFEAHYAGGPGAGWEIDQPQRLFAELARQGQFHGPVLDIGCGTGEIALMTAALGLETTGVDAAPSGIAIAARKARERGLAVQFLVHDVFALAGLERQFNTVLDCGLFHCFPDEERPALVDSLRAVMPEGGRYYMMCYSELEPGTAGPRRVTAAEIEASFAAGWRIDTLRRTCMEVALAPGTASAWFAAITRIMV